MKVLNNKLLLNDPWSWNESLEKDPTRFLESVDYQIIPLALLQNAMDSTENFTDKKFAVSIHHPNQIDEIKPWLGKAQFIAIYFNVFKNGTGFSIARTLRERLQYTKEIRAIGHIIPDQYPLLIQSGFDCIALPEKHSSESIWHRSLELISDEYQSKVNSDNSKTQLLGTIFKQRHPHLL